jgi:hypothetical protein
VSISLFVFRTSPLFIFFVFCFLFFIFYFLVNGECSTESKEKIVALLSIVSHFLPPEPKNKPKPDKQIISTLFMPFILGTNFSPRTNQAPHYFTLQYSIYQPNPSFIIFLQYLRPKHVKDQRQWRS